MNSGESVESYLKRIDKAIEDMMGAILADGSMSHMNDVRSVEEKAKAVEQLLKGLENTYTSPEYSYLDMTLEDLKAQRREVAQRAIQQAEAFKAVLDDIETIKSQK